MRKEPDSVNIVRHTCPDCGKTVYTKEEDYPPKDCVLCERDSNKSKPFNGFWARLKIFIENVEVSDPMSEEEKEMILGVCNEAINNAD